MHLRLMKSSYLPNLADNCANLPLESRDELTKPYNPPHKLHN